MAWSNDNSACLVTWGVLAALQQTEDAFADVGEDFMPALWFWNPNDDEVMTKKKARSLASQMEKVFRLVFEAKLVKGNAVDAMTAMAEILGNEDKKIEDLAAKVDELYTFPGEIV
jgi:hypothetical protein